MRYPYMFAICISSLFITGQALSRPTDAGRHTQWSDLLQAHVHDGLVDYKGMQKDKKKLDAYQTLLATTDMATLSQDEKLAFWINAYNAFTIQLILNHYPLKSIRDIKDPWKQKIWLAAGTTRSLDDIEHKILRKAFKEPRIHFAIVCASIGCPDLWNRAYTGKGIQKELDQAARRFIQSNKHISTASTHGFLGKKKPVLRISRIFKWFADDFSGNGKQGVAKIIAKYASEEVREVIHSAGDHLGINYLKYDWNLNEQK